MVLGSSSDISPSRSTSKSTVVGRAPRASRSSRRVKLRAAPLPLRAKFIGWRIRPSDATVSHSGSMLSLARELPMTMKSASGGKERIWFTAHACGPRTIPCRKPGVSAQTRKKISAASTSAGHSARFIQSGSRRLQDLDQATDAVVVEGFIDGVQLGPMQLLKLEHEIHGIERIDHLVLDQVGIAIDL